MSYAILNPHNRQRKRERLLREIQHFTAQLERYAGGSTPQEKRCHTTALRCLKRRRSDLTKLEGPA